MAITGIEPSTPISTFLAHLRQQLPYLTTYSVNTSSLSSIWVYNVLSAPYRASCSIIHLTMIPSVKITWCPCRVCRGYICLCGQGTLFCRREVLSLLMRSSANRVEASQLRVPSLRSPEWLIWRRLWIIVETLSWFVFGNGDWHVACHLIQNESVNPALARLSELWKTLQCLPSSVCFFKIRRSPLRKLIPFIKMNVSYSRSCWLAWKLLQDWQNRLTGAQSCRLGEWRIWKCNDHDIKMLCFLYPLSFC